MRWTTRYPVSGENSLWNVYKTVSFWKVMKNFIIIQIEAMIGANVTILPGVKIGDGATVSAGTLVHRDVPSGAFVGGNPMRIIYTKEQMTAREGSW